MAVDFVNLDYCSCLPLLSATGISAITQTIGIAVPDKSHPYLNYKVLEPQNLQIKYGDRVRILKNECNVSNRGLMSANILLYDNNRPNSFRKIEKIVDIPIPNRLNLYKCDESIPQCYSTILSGTNQPHNFVLEPFSAALNNITDYVAILSTNTTISAFGESTTDDIRYTEERIGGNTDFLYNTDDVYLVSSISAMKLFDVNSIGTYITNAVFSKGSGYYNETIEDQNNTVVSYNSEPLLSKKDVLQFYGYVDNVRVSHKNELTVGCAVVPISGCDIETLNDRYFYSNNTLYNNSGAALLSGINYLGTSFTHIFYNDVSSFNIYDGNATTNTLSGHGFITFDNLSKKAYFNVFNNEVLSYNIYDNGMISIYNLSGISGAGFVNYCNGEDWNVAYTYNGHVNIRKSKMLNGSIYDVSSLILSSINPMDIKFLNRDYVGVEKSGLLGLYRI